MSGHVGSSGFIKKEGERERERENAGFR
jgi:hypothetical protein